MNTLKIKNNISKEIFINVRKAEVKDIVKVFYWRNNLKSRRMSHNTKKVKWKTHANWFKKKLYDNKNLLLICFEKFKKFDVGITKFDIKGKEALISINLKNTERGKGLAYKCLNSSIVFFKNEHHVKSIIAEIKSVNISSIKSFRRSGFKIYKKVNSKVFMIKRF